MDETPAVVYDEDNVNFNIDEFDIVVFTDGCCYRNGKSGSEAGYGVCFKDDYKPSISEKLYGERQTANRAELMAIKRAIEILYDDIVKGKKVIIEKKVD